MKSPKAMSNSGQSRVVAGEIAKMTLSNHGDDQADRRVFSCVPNEFRSPASHRRTKIKNLSWWEKIESGKHVAIRLAKSDPPMEVRETHMRARGKHASGCPIAGTAEKEPARKPSDSLKAVTGTTPPRRLAHLVRRRLRMTAAPACPRAGFSNLSV